MNDHNLMTTKEAAAYMRLSASALNNLRKDGLPWVQLGKRVFYKQADLDTYIETCTTNVDKERNGE